MALDFNLKMIREAAGETQVDLVFDADIERSRIPEIEPGHVNASLSTPATPDYCLNVTLQRPSVSVTATMLPSWKGDDLRRSN